MSEGLGLLANALAGGIKSSAETAERVGMDKIRSAREEAFRREGWDREDTLIKNENERQDRLKEDERKYQRERDDREYGRKVSLAKMKASGDSQKNKEMKVVNTDDGVIVTQGDQAFRMVGDNLVPLQIGQIPDLSQSEEITEESQPGFFSRLKDSLIEAAKNKNPNSSEAAMFETQQPSNKKPEINYDIMSFNTKQKSLLNQAQNQLPEDTPIEEIIEALYQDPRTSKFFK